MLENRGWSNWKCNKTHLSLFYVTNGLTTAWGGSNLNARIYDALQQNKTMYSVLRDNDKC